MIIDSIKLINFRNHANYTLKCTDEVTLILGANGWGKTSILEAIYILTQGKSFRATDRDIVKHDAEFYRIELGYTNGEKIIATYDGEHKLFQIVDKKAKRLPAKQKYPVILFLPSDLNLVSHAPGRRRDYFDRIFGQLDENYSSAVSKYEKAVRQRNQLLKTEPFPRDSVFSWNLLLARYGSFICQERQKYITEINSLLTDTYRSIAENQDIVEIIYSSETLNLSESAYLSKLETTLDKDLCLGHTTFGIHHDDYIFHFNHQPADVSASRGETRSVILALKFIEAKLVNQKLGRKPIILLDDVFSELDATRRHCLVKNFQDHQVIITSVESLQS